MAITKRNDGKYIVRFSKRHPTTRRSESIRKVCATMAEAKRIELQLPVLWERRFNPQQSPDASFKEVLLAYFDELKARSDNGELSFATTENHRLCLNAHALPLWERRKIGSIATDEIRHLIRVGIGEKSVAHRKNMKKYLTSLFRFAVETGYLQRNPVPHMQFREPDKIKGVLNEVQIKILLEQAMIHRRDDWYPIWAAAVYTGCRTSELHHLTWDKVNLEDRSMHITCAWTKKGGFKDLLKNRQDRVVEIAPPLVPVLKELRAKEPHAVFVFPRIPDWDMGRQAEILRTFLSSVGLPRMRFHDLRASWCTACLGRGIPLVKVMAMGGWKDLKTMQKYVRKSGLLIRGMTDDLKFHNPTHAVDNVISIGRKS